MSFTRALAVLALLSSVPAIAQEKTPPRLLRILAIGDMPPFQQEIRDGVSYELDAKPGSIPPRLLQINLGEEKVAQTSLTLGDFTESFTIASTAMTLRMEKKEGETWSKWHDVALPATGNLALFLWREPKLNSWTSVRSAVLADGIDTFPAGAVRLANLLPTPVKFSFASKSIEVTANSAQIEALTAENNPLQISVMDASGAWRIIYQSAVTQNTGERATVVVYRADGESPRSPVKVLNLRERAPTVPVKKITP